MELTIVGGGLAGSEAAWQAAESGLRVTLYEMRPSVETGAHRTDSLAELVCSNSLGSKLPDRATGILLNEIKHLGSLLIGCAERFSVPAGGALAVDRDGFARAVTQKIRDHPQIRVVREEVIDIPDGLTIITTGPLTSPRLSEALKRLTGDDHLYFFDALAPIVEAESVDMSLAYSASRYGRGELEEGDYINCPLDEDEYEIFVNALRSADRIPLREFEEVIRQGVKAGAHHYFEGCLPVEIIAERGKEALAFGPMRPVGLLNPHSKKRPYAVLQLRRDNLMGSLYNLVGFQTNLTYAEQRRVFRLVPGLQNARFIRYGQMHRNTFINAPEVIRETLQFKSRDDLLLAGQITGVEGYMGNIATGLLAGINASRFARGCDPLVLPHTTMLGALCHYITSASSSDFQPMKANLGLLPKMNDGVRRNRRDRAKAYAERSRKDLVDYFEKNNCA
ncbi:MAG: methylenetetrahydrofolate--tRNA-(uracil(54)-C(5))-methyltransferase (FADH(2)-oxidizing) TrmFO [Anaerolineales bacterium]